MSIHLSVGRDGSATRYEYCLFARDHAEDDGKLVARKDGYKTATAARRAGLAHGQQLSA